MRTEWGDVMSGLHRVPLVTTGGKSRCFAGGVDASNLHPRGRDPNHTKHHDRHQSGDRECGLDGGSTAVTGQTLVLSARLMMLVSAVTIESPVTTV